MSMTEADHDILMKQQIKLDQICSSIGELKTESKELNKIVSDGFKQLNEKLLSSSVDCVMNRASCQKEIANKYVTTKMVVFALSVNTAILTGLGLVLKWTGVI